MSFAVLLISISSIVGLTHLQAFVNQLAQSVCETIGKGLPDVRRREI